MSGAHRSPEADQTEVLRDEIAQTREELAETAQALGDKLDVKQQARSAASTVQDRVQELPDRAAAQWQRDPVPIAAGVAAFLVVLVLLGWRGRR